MPHWAFFSRTLFQVYPSFRVQHLGFRFLFLLFNFLHCRQIPKTPCAFSITHNQWSAKLLHFVFCFLSLLYYLLHLSLLFFLFVATIRRILVVVSSSQWRSLEATSFYNNLCVEPSSNPKNFGAFHLVSATCIGSILPKATRYIKVANWQGQISKLPQQQLSKTNILSDFEVLLA
jgi:hypothetical protein